MKTKILLLISILLTLPLVADLNVDIPFDTNVVGQAWDGNNYTFSSDQFFVTNLGETDDFTITVSSDNLPEGWNLMWCMDGMCSPVLVQEIEFTQNHELDLDFVISPVSSASNCDIQFLFEAPSLNEAVAIQFHFRTADAASSNEMNIPQAKPTLMQNYPNPFNPSTTIEFFLAEPDEVNLVVYNSKGQEVVSLFEGIKNSGTHTVTWDGYDKNGNAVTSGMYFYKLRSSRYNTLKKMILMK